ncbi:MAG: serine hydrolase [Pseudomonadota bacterium]
MRLKNTLLPLLALFALALVVAATTLLPRVLGVTRILAAVGCNQTFGGYEPWDTLVERDLSVLGDLDPYVSLRPDSADRSVSGRLLGIPVTTAVYHPGYGCVSADSPGDKLAKHRAKEGEGMPLARAETGFPRLNAFIRDEFEKYGDETSNGVNHRAFVVLHRGKIIAEHYAPPIGPATRFASQSMAKSVNALLWAAADMRGLLDLDGPVAAPEWDASDPRQAISNRHLLDMVSGLDFDENYEMDLFSQFFDMILSGDLGHFAANLKLVHTPGDRWYYSTADANLSGRTLGFKLAERGYSVHRFADEALFRHIAADPVELQIDNAGSFWAGSAVHMTTLDWARLGQLVLDGGAYRGEQLLPAEFLEELAVPLPQSRGWYRSSMWLNRSLDFGEERQLAPGLPDDTVSFSGFQGQKVHIIPSKDMVIVRFGRTDGEGGSDVYKRLIADAYELTLEEAASAPLDVAGEVAEGSPDAR